MSDIVTTETAELAARIRETAAARLTRDVGAFGINHPMCLGLVLAREVHPGEPHLAMRAHGLLVASARNSLREWGGVDEEIPALVNLLLDLLERSGWELTKAGAWEQTAQMAELAGRVR